MGDSVFSIFVVDRHFFPVNWVTANRAFHSTFIFLKITCYNSPVTPLDGMRFQLLGQITVSRVILAYKKSSCSVLINTVDDSRAHNAVNTGQIALTVVHNSIYQSSAGVAVCRMDYHSFGLIYHQYIIIFVQNVQRDIFRKNIRFSQIRQGCLNQIPCLYFVVCFYCFPIDGNTLFFQKLLKIRTGKFLIFIGKTAVYAHSCFIFGCCKFQLLHVSVKLLSQLRGI